MKWIETINSIIENEKTHKIGFLIFAGIFILMIILTLTGCDVLQGSQYKDMYEKKVLQLEQTEIELVRSNQTVLEKTLQVDSLRQSEIILRKSIDSLYTYSVFKLDSLYSVIEIKNIIIRSNDANIDTMLYSIHFGVINYINKLHAKYGIEGVNY